jgi:purine-binding chemotaxis protein CheW
MSAVATIAPASGARDAQGAARKYLTFVLGTSEYGVPVQKVREIIKAMEITSVPQVAPYVKGVINLRGKVIPVADLRLKFGLSQAEYTDRTCIIVVEMALRSAVALIGVVVDSVSDVVSIAAEEIEDAPDLTEQNGSGCVEALAKVKGTVKIIVNLDRLFASDDAEIAAVGSSTAPNGAPPFDDAHGGLSVSRRPRS